MSRIVPESVLLLAADLKRIREMRGLTVAQVSRAMHQGADVIESIERSLLMDNPIFNAIYLRPMLRKYGQMLKLEEEKFLHAADQAFEGVYESDWRDREDIGTVEVRPPSRPIVVPERPVLHYELEPVRIPTKRFRLPTASKGMYKGVMWMGVIALLGGLGWIALSFWPTDLPSAPKVEDPARTIINVMPPSVSPPIVLPERITLAIQADSLPVRGLRVQLDQDQRRPYWIEPRQSRTFSFADSVRLYDAEAGSGQLRRISVSIEGRPYPSTMLVGREVVIRRNELAGMLLP